MKDTVRKLECQKGFTLLELIITLAILALLMTIAIPNLAEFIKNNRVTAQHNEMVALINVARNEAIRRHLTLGATGSVTLRLDNSTDGWTGNVSVSTGETTQGCPTGVIRCADNSRVTLSPSEVVIRFDSRGYLRSGGWDSRVICLKHQASCAGDRQHRRLTILPSGQIETEFLSCDTDCFVL